MLCFRSTCPALLLVFLSLALGLVIVLETGLSMTPKDRNKLNFFSILVQIKIWACSRVYLKLLEKTNRKVTKSFWIKHGGNLLQLQGVYKKFTGNEYV